MFQQQLDDVDVATVGGSVQSGGATVCLRIGTGAMIQEQLTHRLVSCSTGVVLQHKSPSYNNEKKTDKLSRSYQFKESSCTDKITD